LKTAEWIPLPPARGGIPCPVSGLPRSSLCKLTVPCAENGLTPPVKSKLVKVPGATRGRRMVNVPSLLAWIETQPDVGEVEDV
jgi:hypothetical protein